MHRLGAERAPYHGRGREFERQAKLADMPGAFGPFRRRPGKLRKVALVIKARHGVVRLRLEIDLENAFLRERLEEWKRVARKQVMNERRDEHRLAGSRQAGHAKAHGWLQE